MSRGPNCRPVLSRSGFTLIEVLVALAVVGVATSVFISLYSSSLELAKKSRNESVAVTLAEAQLAKIVRKPERFFWDHTNRDASGRFPLGQGQEDPPAGNLFDPPAAMPAEQSANDREENLYKAFRWTAFAERDPMDSHYVVVVVVRWEEGGRDRSIALTSALPVAAVYWVPATDAAPSADETASPGEDAT